MARLPIVGLAGTVKAGTVASTAKYWASRGLTYNQIVSKLHAKFKTVSLKHVYKWSSYFYSVYNQHLSFTKKEWGQSFTPTDVPTRKGRPTAFRANVVINTKNPLTSRKQEYHFQLDVKGTKTKGELFEQIRQKIIDHFLYYYEKRGIREVHILRLIASLRITSLEGI